MAVCIWRINVCNASMREFEDDLSTFVLVMRNLLFMPAAQLLRTKPCTRELLLLSAAAVHATANRAKDHGEKLSVSVWSWGLENAAWKLMLTTRRDDGILNRWR